MTIARAIEVTADRAASAADRAYQLKEEQVRDWLDRQPTNWKAEAIRWKASFEHECKSNVEARAKIGAMDETIYALRQKLRAYDDALLECRDYFDGRMDADCDEYGNYHPSEEMQLVTLIDEARGRR